MSVKSIFWLIFIFVFSCNNDYCGDGKLSNGEQCDPPDSISCNNKCKKTKPTVSKIGDQLLEDSTPDIVITAYNDHQPTNREIKLAAAFWIFLAESKNSGEMDPIILESRLVEEILLIADKYPSFFITSGGDVSLRSISSPNDFSCDNSCSPSLELISNVMSEPVNFALDVIADNPFISQMHQRLIKDIEEANNSGNSAIDAIEGSMTDEEADNVIEQIAEAIGIAGDIASAAKKLGIGGAGATIIAEAATVVAATVVVVHTADNLFDATALVLACKEFKLQQCQDIGHCTDGLDNDFDGFIDCTDPDCVGDLACALGSENCTDSNDNDADGLIDCADPNCGSSLDCNASAVGFVAVPQNITNGVPATLGDAPALFGATCPNGDVCSGSTPQCGSCDGGVTFWCFADVDPATLSCCEAVSGAAFGGNFCGGGNVCGACGETPDTAACISPGRDGFCDGLDLVTCPTGEQLVTCAGRQSCFTAAEVAAGLACGVCENEVILTDAANAVGGIGCCSFSNDTVNGAIFCGGGQTCFTCDDANFFCTDSDTGFCQ